MTIDRGWFVERSPLWPGRALTIEIERELYNARSAYQSIQVFETVGCGRMLVLDGIIQLTESDEFAYHEMLAHIPLCAHPRPRRVLVIGGGDGGIVREVARHDGVEQIDLCELDPQVIEVSPRYLPALALALDDPRVRIHIEDGITFIERAGDFYDVIIVDSTDPVGPAESLFGAEFHTKLRAGLRRGGIVAAQGESIFLHPDLVQGMLRMLAALYPIWGHALTLVPTYPGGSIGISLGSLGPTLERAVRPVEPALQDQLRYYTPEIHTAAFVLPGFGQRQIAGAAGSGSIGRGDRG